MQRVLKDSFLVVGTKIISLFLGLITSIFLVRMLGAEGKGYLTLIEVGVGMIILSTTLNLNISIVHFVAKNKVNISVVQGIAIYIYIGSLVATALFFGVFYFFDLKNPLFAASDNSQYLHLFFILLIINEVKEYLSAFLRGAKSFKDLYKSTILYSILRLIIFGGLFLAFHYLALRLNYSTLIGLHVGTIAILTLFIFRYYTQIYKNRPKFNLKWTEIRPVLLFSTLGFITGVLNFLSLKLDIWFVESSEGTVQLGYYAIALGLTEMVSQIPASLRTVLLPYLSSSECDEEQLRHIVFFSKITCTVTILIGIVLFFSASFVVPLMYGNSFIPAVAPLKILVFGMVIFSFKGILVMLNITKNRQQLNIYSHIVGILILIPLCILFIDWWGILGAAYAVLISYLGSMLYLFIVVINKKYLPLRNYFFLSLGDIKNLTSLVKKMLKK